MGNCREGRVPGDFKSPRVGGVRPNGMRSAGLLAGVKRWWGRWETVANGFEGSRRIGTRLKPCVRLHVGDFRMGGGEGPNTPLVLLALLVISLKIEGWLAVAGDLVVVWGRFH